MVIKVENLSKSFKNVQVLKNINLILEDGKIYGLNGRNGSGKTVFCKLLCGLYSPTEGTVKINDEILNLENNYKFEFGALIENPKFFPDLTGYQNLEVLAKIKKQISKEDILNALKAVNLINEKDKKYGKYSLGMKQKLGIAQAIMEDQKIIILDEPFNGIEEETVKKIRELLIKEKKRGKIIIISTHIKEDLDILADKIFYFKNGLVVNNDKE